MFEEGLLQSQTDVVALGGITLGLGLLLARQGPHLGRRAARIEEQPAEGEAHGPVVAVVIEDGDHGGAAAIPRDRPLTGLV